MTFTCKITPDVQWTDEMHDQSTTLITKPGGWRELINFSLVLMGLFGFCSSCCPRRRANPDVKSCKTSGTQTSQQTSTPKCVLITVSGFKSKILHVNDNLPHTISVFEVATFGNLVCAVEDVEGCASLDNGASRHGGGYTMVQHVIDSLLLTSDGISRTCNKIHLCGW